MATNIRIMIETQDEIGAQHDEVSMDAAFELFKSVSGLTERGKEENRKKSEKDFPIIVKENQKLLPQKLRKELPLFSSCVHVAVSELIYLGGV